MRALLKGGTPVPVEAATLLELLELRAGSRGPWLVFHHGHRVEAYSADDVLRRAWMWGAGMRGLPGARVGIWHPNSLDFVASFFGALGAGATPVPIAWPVLEGDLAGALERLDPVLARGELKAIAAPARTLLIAKGPGWVTPRAAHGFDGPRPTADAPAFIQFTSGSTGLPRGAVISQRAAVYNATALVKGLGLGPHDVGVSWVPFFHDMGLVGVMLASLVGGFTTHVLRPSEFLLHPWTWLDLIDSAQATLTVAPDFGYGFAVRRCRERNPHLSSLRCALTGSEPIHASTLTAFCDRFAPGGFHPEAFVGAYGLAENTLGVTVGPALSGHRLPSVGAPLAGMDVALDGPSSEICVRSPSLMTGYFEAPEETARALDGGWLRTGDLGRIEDGQLFVIGREKEVVIKAGQKFHPSQIEQLVATNVDAPPNGVAAFNNAADELVLVIEQRRAIDPVDTARVRALIVDRLGVRVDRVEWVPAGSLPRTTSGKLRRSACAEQFGGAL